MPFEKGESGNPAGRPRGSRNRTALLMENLLGYEAEAIGRKAVEIGNKRRYGGHSPVHGSPRAGAKGRAGRVRVAAAREARRQRRGGGDAGGGGRGGRAHAVGGRAARQSH